MEMHFNENLIKQKYLNILVLSQIVATKTHRKYNSVPDMWLEKQVTLLL